MEKYHKIIKNTECKVITDCMLRTIIKHAKLDAVDEFVNEVIHLESKRITDNNDYISIPIKDWLDFKQAIISQSQLMGTVIV